MSIKKKLSLVRNLLMFTVIGWFLLTFMIIPVISVFKTTFFAEGTFSFEAIIRLATSDRVRKSLANTFVMAFWSVIRIIWCVFGKMKVSQKVSKKLAPQMA